MTLLGLREIIRASPRLRLIATERDGPAALAGIRSHRPDVAVLDAHLDRPDACEIIRTVGADAVPTRTIVIAEQHSGELVVRSFSAGAAGFLSKRTEGSAVVDAILRVAAGRSVLPSDVGPSVVERLQKRAEGEQLRPSERELEVLRRIAQGLTAVAIAQQLGISTATVKTHIQNLYGKLGVNDRGAAVAVGIRTGLLE